MNSKKKNPLMRWLGAVVVIGLAAGAKMLMGGDTNTAEEALSLTAMNQPVNSQKVSSKKSKKSSNTHLMEIPQNDGASKGQRLDRKGYALCYDSDKGTPQWVAWELTREETRGKLERTDWFEADEDVKGKRVEYNDYSGSGYDRGHMAPAGDMKWDMEAMEESFLMSNICPQNHELNKGSWNDLEIETRQWARKYGKAYVVCGPIYDSDKKLKRIGRSHVAVPHHFYKAVLIYPNGNPLVLGFVFSNDGKHKTMKQSLVSVDQLEKRTGLDFFSKLPDDEEKALEAVTATLP